MTRSCKIANYRSKNNKSASSKRETNGSEGIVHERSTVKVVLKNPLVRPYHCTNLQYA